jgi:copper(I)-binding protein
MLILGACGPGRSGVIEVTDSWAPSTPPNAPTAVIYIQIDNGTDDDDRLVDVAVDRCEAIELHTTNIDEDRIMRMRLATPEALTIPAGETLEMIPGGLHVMCIGLDQPFRVGETLDLDIQLESGTNFQVPTPVENR